MTIIAPNMMQSVAICIVTLFIGKWLRKKVSFFDRFCIPAPVIGGFLFAIIHLILRQAGILEFQMDTTLQSPFMMFFFTSIGLTSSVEVIKKGGVGVLLFYMITVILVFGQNLIGVGVAKLMHQDTQLGLLCGSITMVGGHGTAGVWGPIFEEAGMPAGEVVGMAAATFGLIMGSLIGGPIGGRLIKKHKLKPNTEELGMEANDLLAEQGNTEITVDETLKTMAIIFVSIAIGVILKGQLVKVWSKLILPEYVTSMFIAGIYRNTIGGKPGKWQVSDKCASLLGEVGLNVFLAMALSSLKLWQLAAVAGPMIVILIIQTIFMALFSYIITFKVMGSDFDAAILSAGMCGFGMGATANGVANMQSVTENYGPSQKAFFILPVVGAFLIDITNTFIITLFASIF